MTFFGNIENGIMTLKDTKVFKSYIKNQKDCTIQLTIKKYRRKRSSDQNNLYWLWLEMIGNDLGYTADELHASFRAMFLTDKTKKIPLVRSTTALNTKEFCIYLGKVERQASELGITLPQPENWRL